MISKVCYFIRDLVGTLVRISQSGRVGSTFSADWRHAVPVHTVAARQLRRADRLTSVPSHEDGGRWVLSLGVVQLDKPHCAASMPGKTWYKEITSSRQ